VTKKEEEMLRRWERKILRGIYGAVREGEEWRIRTNGEIQQLSQKPDIVVEIKRARMRWAGHVQRMPEERVVKKMFTVQPGGSRRKGRSRLRWVDDLEEDLRKIGTRGWRGMEAGYCRGPGCSTADDDDDDDDDVCRS
jgi:hypothetical protein